MCSMEYTLYKLYLTAAVHHFLDCTIFVSIPSANDNNTFVTVTKGFPCGRREYCCSTCAFVHALCEGKLARKIEGMVPLWCAPKQQSSAQQPSYRDVLCREKERERRQVCLLEQSQCWASRIKRKSKHNVGYDTEQRAHVFVVRAAIDTCRTNSHSARDPKPAGKQN